MEILSPTHSLRLSREPFARVSATENARNGDELPDSLSPKVYVAVGRSESKAVELLQWSFQQFGHREICILHVHQPSPTIPTLLGKLPASQANPKVVSAYRKEEKEQMKKLLLNYLTVCFRSKVQARVVTIEAGQVQRGILDLVNKYHIQKLVIEAVPENWMKVKKISKKESYMAQIVPPFCEIWFVNKRKVVWMREASVTEDSNIYFDSSEILRSQSLPHRQRQSICSSGHTLSCSSTSVLSNGTSNFGEIEESVSFAEQRVISEYDLMAEEENLCSQLARVEIEVEQSRIEAFAELTRCKILESEASDVISQVKALEAAQTREAELREAADMELRTTIEEQEKLLEEREAIIKQLSSTMRNISLLDVRAKETNRRCEEAAGELKIVQTSITALKQEKNLIRRQKTESMSWVDRWKTRSQDVGNCEDLENVLECSLSDLQTATCDFSDSFIIGQGEHGCVYKGEIFDRTVAVKQLHPHNMQGQSEFLQQVQLLGKIRHPNLVSIIGTCLEAWAVIYEYLPNNNLQHHLFQKRNNPLNWKVRARIVAQIANALLHLHSKSPNIIHGDLKPENILFDSQLNCKISDYGISRLVPTETLLRCPSFRKLAEPKGTFCYMDPEFRQTGNLSTKSDMYSFGLVVLQLLTGRSAVGLVGEVRRAVSSGRLPSLLAGEWPTFVANRLVEVGLQCCEANGRDRLELNSGIVRELEKFHVLEELVVPSFFLCPIRQDIMHDPQVAADGFTYEGEAMRGWLENGRETSPMTNLKLENSLLTPNHALRLAIREWLSRS